MYKYHELLMSILGKEGVHSPAVRCTPCSLMSYPTCEILVGVPSDFPPKLPTKLYDGNVGTRLHVHSCTHGGD